MDEWVGERRMVRVGGKKGGWVSGKKGGWMSEWEEEG